MIILNIDFKKIDQSRLKKTDKSSYGDLVLIDHPSEHNGIHSDGFVKQGVSKEEREARVEMPIIGNWKRVGQKAQDRPPAKRPPASPPVREPEDEIPF